MTGWKTWAALEEVTAANMNSYVRDQTIQVFNNAASRLAAIGSPSRGLVSFLTDSGALEVYYGATTGWARPWNQPWGIVSYSFDTTNRTTTGATYVDASTATWTATPTANRLYRLTAYAGLQLTGATAGYARVAIRDGANAVQNFRDIYTQLTTAPTTVVIEDYFTTAAVSTTRKVSIASPVTGTHQLLNATSALRMFIEDMGPASSTAPAA